MKSAVAGLALIISLWIIGCGKVLPIHYYDLRYPTTAVSNPTPKHDKTLAVANFQATSIYRQSRILYREGANSSKVGFYDNRHWVAPPTELLTQAVILHFRNLYLFTNVIPYADASMADYILRGRITELEEVDLSDGYYGQITIFASLTDVRSGKVLWSASVHSSQKTTTRDVDVIVDKIAQGVGEVLQSLAEIIDRVVTNS